MHAKLLMVEGRLQREKEVVHVIVSKCVDLSKMLGKLAQREGDDLPVLTVSAACSEKSAPYPAQHKRTQVREDVSKNAFHGGRNFK